MSGGQLGIKQRAGSIEALKTQAFDVLVIGGGVTGCGAALDAVTRGYSVALVEARDFASGTSSRSSKLIHGGLRYLEMLDFGLVREALTERGLLTKTLAPHLVQPLPFVMPLHKGIGERAYMGAGLFLYDALARMGRVPRLPWHRHLTRKQTLKKWPALKREGFVGGLQYYDAQVDDARFVMMLARTAAAHGAHVLNRCVMRSLMRDGTHLTGATVEIDGETIDVNAKVVINAAGVWLPEVSGELESSVAVRASKGVHIVVPRDRIRATTGLISRTEKSVLFVIPWGSHWIIGTTDTEWHYDKAHPAASKGDIDYLLEHVNAVLETPLSHADIEGVYAGLRPLVAAKNASTAKLSREHAVTQIAPGFVGVTGGKYTTYRIMAKDAVDVATMGEYPCRTDEVPVLGASGYSDIDEYEIARQYGISVTQTERLLHRYGSLIDEVLTAGALRTLPGTDDYLEAEVVYAATHEGALYVEDVLVRRTRMSIESWSRGTDAAERVAQLLGDVLGWDDDRRRREVETYRARVAAERAANEAETDAEANAERTRSVEIRTNRRDSSSFD